MSHPLIRPCVSLCVLLLITYLALTSAQALGGEDDLTFHLSLDGKLSADVAAGSKAAKKGGRITFVEGASGKALLVGERHASLRFPVKGNLSGREGTISMWIKAVDWEPDDKKFHVFFGANKGGWLQLYTHQGGQLLMLAGADSKTYQITGDSVTKLTKGKWHHVVGTWSPRMIALYLDGNPAGARNISEEFLPRTLSGMFEIGDVPWATGRTKAKTTAIDEVRIYSAALDIGRVRTLYGRLASMAPGAEPNTETAAPEVKPLKATPTPRDRKNAALFKEILFRASYDQGVDADIHKGDPKCKTQGKVVFDEGRFGKAIAVGEEFARLAYTMGSNSHPINLSCREGSLSFHFKAVDWEPSEKRSHLLFRVKSLALLRVFTDSEGMLVFETGSDVDQRNGVKASLADRKKGEWIHVAATWCEKEIRLYLDGKLAVRKENEDRFLSHARNTTFEVGDIPRAMGREGARKTLIDDLTIYRRPLAQDELFRVDEPKSAGTAPEYAPPVVAIPRAIESPIIDGTFSADEWKVAAELTNFASVSDHKLAPVQTKAYVTYDNKRVYVAVVSPVLPGVELTANRTKRDDNVWQDDAVQIYMTVPSGNRFMFIGNSIGTIYDRRYQKGIKDDVTWNGNWQYETNVAGGVWTAEVAITFADMALDAPADGETWRFNITRDRVEPQNLSAWPALSTYADTPKHGYLTFTGTGPALSAAPGYDGMIANEGDLSAAFEGAALAEKATVEVEWIAAAAGKILLVEREDLTVEPGGDARATFKRALEAAPDAFTFTARDKAAGRVLYRQTSTFSEREAIALTFSPVPSQGVCKITMKVGDLGLAALNPAARVEVIPQDRHTPVATMQIATLKGGRGAAEFDLDKLEPGTVTVRTQLTTYGKTVATKIDTFTKPDEPWRGTTLGLSDIPPPPWTPIEVSEAKDASLTVGCWNRKHLFEGAPLPTSIENGAARVLAAPVRIAAKVAGHEQTWTPGELVITGKDKNKVVFKTTQTSASLSLAAETTMEFDGMLWTEITISPAQKLQLDALDLVVPIKDEYAKYRHWPGDVPLTGNMGRKDGWRWQHELPSFAYLWLGNDDLGLTWFFETWEQFRFADEKTIVELVRKDGTLSLVIHYVGEPVSLEKPLTLSFGLQATPTRPRPKGWRGWGGGNIVGTNIHVPWTAEEDHRYGAGYLEASNPDYYHRYVKGSREKGWKVLPYNAILWSANFSPEMRHNVADWDLGGGINKYNDYRRFWWGRRICGGAQSYREFYTWKARSYIESTGIDGLYHDLQWSYRCGNPDHGYSETHRTFRGDRELNKRLYTMMKGFGRPLWKFDHASNLICSLTSPFSDLFTTGEEMGRHPPDGKHPDHKIYSNYFHNMRLGYFKACGATGRQWGVAPCFITAMTSDSPGYTEALYAILVPHDAIPTWAMFRRDVRYMRRLQRTVAEFGIGSDDVEFLPYWHDTTPAKVTFSPDGGGPIRPFQVNYEIPEENKLLPEEAVGASVYRRKGKRSLVAVFNYTRDDGVAKVKIDLDKLGLSGERVLATDAFTRLSWVRVSGEIQLPVKSLNYRMIWVEDLQEYDYERATIVDAFPPYPEEAMLAGHRPGDPRAESVGMEVAGDIRKDPWRDGDSSYTGPQRTELAQTFTIEKPCTAHRIEVFLNDSEGAFAIRKTVRLRIVKLSEDGLPTEDEVVGADGFAATEADSRYWRYRYFEFLRSVKFDPGRYAIVFSKPAEGPAEFFHARFPAVKADELPGEYLATREHPARDGSGFRWTKASDRVVCFGVYGREQPAE